MSRAQPYGHVRFGVATYSVGLALIASATILNLSLDKLPPKELYSLPDFLVLPYDQAGPMGVTLILAGVGIVLVLLGFLGTILRGKSRVDSEESVDDSTTNAGKASSQPQIATDASSGKGVMVMQTQKYLGKKRYTRSSNSD